MREPQTSAKSIVDGLVKRDRELRLDSGAVAAGDPVLVVWQRHWSQVPEQTRQRLVAIGACLDDALNTKVLPLQIFPQP